MALFSRRTQSVDTGVEPQVEYQQAEGRRWPTLLVYMVTALLVSAGVVLAGRWIYDKTSDSSNDSEQVTTNESGNSNSLSEEQKKARNNSSAGNQNPVSPPPSGNNSRSPGQSPAPQPGALPSSGPKDVVAIFITSSLAAAGLHFIVSLRRKEA